MPWSCLCSSKKSKKSKYNENIKNHNVPENSEPEKKRKAKFYSNLRLDQCETGHKTNNSSSLDSQFDQKSLNELNEHLYDSFDTLPNEKSKVDTSENNRNYLNNGGVGGSKRSALYENEDNNGIRPKHLILCLSNENLPYIDAESPMCSGGYSTFKNERIIHVMPKNMNAGRQNNNFSNEWEKIRRMQKYQQTHKYIEVDVMDASVCQKCHKHLSFKRTYKCSICDYVCHQTCAATDKPEIRYTDTSWLVFRQWDPSNKILAFPSCVERYKSQSSLPSRRVNLSQTRRPKQNCKNDDVVDRDDLQVAEQQQLMIVEPQRINDRDLQQRLLNVSGGGYGDRQQQIETSDSSNRRPFRTSPPSPQSNSTALPHSSNRNKNQLYYVTERILAAMLPSKESQFEYDENGNRSGDKFETDLLHMLEQKHGTKFRLFDLESCIPSISLERLCELCKHIEAWLSSGHNKIVVLQDREDFQRIGVSVTAYLQYQKICSRNIAPFSLRSSGNDRNNIQELDEYSMQKFLNDVVGHISEPAYRRYLKYFIGLLSGGIKLNSLPLYLKFIKMESPPCLHHKIHDSEWSSFIKIFEGDKFVFISDIYVMPISTKQFIYEIKAPLMLRGDIFIHFFQVNSRTRQSELISSIQFHTCAIERNEIEFAKADVSFPLSDERFAPDHKITLIFTKSAENFDRGYEDVLIFQNPLIRKESVSSLGDLLPSAHTQGPVDGSLYATVAKSQQQASNQLTEQNIRTIETSQRSISKNSRILSTILEWDNVRNGENGSPIDHNGHDYSQSLTAPTTTNARKPIQEPTSKSYAKSPLMESYDSGIFSHEVSSSNNKNNISSMSAWNDEATTSPSANNNNCHVELDNLLSEMLLTVEALPDLSYSHGTGNPSCKQIAVSPTTTTNHRSNAPLRTSPQRTIESNIHTVPLRNFQHQLDVYNNNYTRNNHDIVETSSITTTTLTPTESRCNTPASEHQYNRMGFVQHDDLYYDTDTQMNLHGGRYQDVSDGSIKRQIENLRNSSQSVMEVGYNRSTSRSSDHSIPYHAREYSKPFTYLDDTKSFKMHSGLSSPSMVRKALNGGSSGRKTPLSHEFEERARYRSNYENSKYSFGDKTPENHLTVFDSEKMFDYRKRTEHNKYLPITSEINDIDAVMTTTKTHFFEPPQLRRSNTMDGSFGRSGYASDGGSSQTWLQVQQKRLRDKKMQQKGDFDFTDGATYRRSQTLSPVRHYNGSSSPSKEPKFVTIKRIEETYTRPYKNYNDRVENNPFDFNHRKSSHSRSYNEKYSSTSSSPMYRNTTTRRRNMPITSSPYADMDQINNNSLDMDTLDSLLESIAFENFTTNIHVAGLLNGNVKDSNSNILTTTNNHEINRKTDALNRYFDNLINFNREYEKYRHPSRKSDSPSDQSSELSDQQSHNNVRRSTQNRNESVSSYRSETETEVSRPETPAFPVTPRTPSHFGSTSTLPPKSPTLQRRDLSNRIHEVANTNETIYAQRRGSSNSAISNSELFEIAPHHVKFARDSSKYWYKPTLTREEAINLLRNASPGTFLVRDSTTFANAFGLVVKVAYPPPGSKGGADELVRHFLVEPTVRGVRLKGCSNEPVFSSLSALIYQHSVTPLALPTRLVLPDRDITQKEFQSYEQRQLVHQGAACNVLYLFSADTESLTGPQAVRKAVKLLFERRPLPTPTEVHFKVSQQGVTLTDNSRQLFFRKHYPANTVTFFGLDPDDRRWSVQISNADIPVKNQHIFAFVAKKTPTAIDNQCHVFCELEARQPASAISSFAQKVLLDEATRQQHIPAQI